MIALTQIEYDKLKLFEEKYWDLVALIEALEDSRMGFRDYKEQLNSEIREGPLSGNLSQ